MVRSPKVKKLATPKLNIDVIRELVDEFPDGVYASEVADIFGVTEKKLLNFMSKIDESDIDQYEDMNGVMFFPIF